MQYIILKWVILYNQYFYLNVDSVFVPLLW